MRPLSETIARAGEWGRYRVWYAQAACAAAVLAVRSARTRGARPGWLLRRLAYLHREGYFVHPGVIAHAAMLQLLDPTAPPERLDEVVSPLRLREVQLRLSPPPLSAVIDDKALFYTTCRLARLPIPEVHAFVYRDEPGWTRDGRTPRTRGQWAWALERVLVDEVIAKPARSDMGEGVRAFRREGDRFFEGSDLVGDAGALYDTLFADGRFGAVVLQRRVHNHETLADLGDTRTLQATRLVTLVDRGDDVTVLFASQKIVRGDGVTDNVHNGETGNGSALVDVETGRLGPLVLPTPGEGLFVSDDHPATGRTCRGLQLPWWPETLELVRRAAVAFGMLRTIGWDVAITPDGPLLLEANSGWGALNGVMPMPPVLRRLKASVRAEEEQAQTLDAELEQLARVAAASEADRSDGAAR